MMAKTNPTQTVSARGAARETHTVEEAGKRLGLGRWAMYEALRRNEIPHIKIGHKILIPRAVIDRMLSGEPQPATAGR
jgi:excisionase family DNA binding protein